MNLKPIGFMHTCFREKFGVPRQSLMMSEAKGFLQLQPDPQFRDALRGLEKFSHVWIIFIFHEHEEIHWRPLTTLPRLEVTEKVGVFASRSPHRPNPIGLSAVKLEEIEWNSPAGIRIHLSGVDLLDGTPVIDIKPYVPFVDSVTDAKGAWTEPQIPRYPVQFSELSLKQIEAHSAHYEKTLRVNLRAFIQQMLEFDPRPTPQRETMPIHSPENQGLQFAFWVLDFDVKWQIQDRGMVVTELEYCLESRPLSSIKKT